MNKKETIVLSRRFLKDDLPGLKWYQDVKSSVKAIILYGSVAKGASRPGSDIDLLFILPLKIEKKYTEGEYFYNFESKKINIVIRSIEKLRKIAAGKHDDFQAEVFRDCFIFWEKDNEISGLINKILAVN